MYIPTAFREDDLPTLHTFMREYNFATLVTVQDGLPFATHLPFLLDTKQGQYGILRTHMARGNPQWRAFHESQEVLVIFQGPHAYISPSWYEPGENVPTWNYAAVHAYGLPHLIEDPIEVYNLLAESVDTFEARFEQPWKLQISNEFLTKKMQGFVALEIAITRLEGKMKLSQNRTVSERQHVISVLETDEQTRDMATLMRQREGGN